MNWKKKFSRLLLLLLIIMISSLSQTQWQFCFYYFCVPRAFFLCTNKIFVLCTSLFFCCCDFKVACSIKRRCSFALHLILLLNPVSISIGVCVRMAFFSLLRLFCLLCCILNLLQQLIGWICGIWLVVLLEL